MLYFTLQQNSKLGEKGLVSKVLVTPFKNILLHVCNHSVCAHRHAHCRACVRSGDNVQDAFQTSRMTRVLRLGSKQFIH